MIKLQKYNRFLQTLKNSWYPGRLVIILVNCQTTKTPQYVDHCLQPHVQKLKFHVIDSTDLITKVFTTK